MSNHFAQFMLFDFPDYAMTVISAMLAVSLSVWVLT
jgi:hypothetical protein